MGERGGGMQQVRGRSNRWKRGEQQVKRGCRRPGQRGDVMQQVMGREGVVGGLN